MWLALKCTRTSVFGDTYLTTSNLANLISFRSDSSIPWSSQSYFYEHLYEDLTVPKGKCLSHYYCGRVFFVHLPFLPFYSFGTTLYPFSLSAPKPARWERERSSEGTVPVVAGIKLRPCPSRGQSWQDTSRTTTHNIHIYRSLTHSIPSGQQ
jgi:hypothetical protein